MFAWTCFGLSVRLFCACWAWWFIGGYCVFIIYFVSCFFRLFYCFMLLLWFDFGVLIIGFGVFYPFLLGLGYCVAFVGCLIWVW